MIHVLMRHKCKSQVKSKSIYLYGVSTFKALIYTKFGGGGGGVCPDTSLNIDMILLTSHFPLFCFDFLYKCLVAPVLPRLHKVMCKKTITLHCFI